MSFISDLMAELKTAAESAITPDPPTPPAGGTKADPPGPIMPVVFGSDPPYGSLCMIQGAGFPSEEHLDTGMLYRLPVLLNGKHESQETLLDAVTAIHAALTKTHDYSGLTTEDVQVINIATTASPSIIGREQNRQWICGSSFEVAFYWR